jgi:hypothetical protein
MNKMAASVETGSSLNLTTSATISHHLHHYQQLALVRRGGGDACAPDAARPPGRRAAAAAGQQALALAHSLTVIGQQLSAQQLSASTHLVGAELSSQHLGQQLSSQHMGQQLASPHHVSQQLSSPHHMSQQLSSPHHMSQQLSSPHHMSQQQLSSPHHMSQQLSPPHLMSQQLSSPHHMGQQLSSPHHMSQQLSSPNHQLSSLYHMARQQTATQPHMALHSSHTNLIGFAAGVRLGGTSAANWSPTAEESVSAMTRSVAALVSPTRLGPAAAAVGLLPDAFMPKFSQHLARILESEQRQQQQDQQQGQASPFYHNYSPKRKLYNLQSNPELHQQSQIQNPAVLQPLQPKLLLQDMRVAYSPTQQQQVHLQQQQQSVEQQPASRLQQQGLQEQKGKLQLAAPQQPRDVVVHKYSSFEKFD